MTAIDAVLEEIRESPNLPSYVNELTVTLRREEKARRRFRESLDEDVRAEFINGRVRPQMPARHLHTTCVRRVSTLMDTHVQARKLGVVLSEQALTAFPRNDYGPDVCFWKKTKAKAFSPDQIIYPIPDFVCEVISPSTAAVDRGIKFQDYEANGVGEYWMADPKAERIEQWVLRGERYELEARFLEGTIRSRVVKGFAMPVRAAFDNVEYMKALKRLLAR